MKKYDIYDAKTNFSKLRELVEQADEIVIARSGKLYVHAKQTILASEQKLNTK